MLINSNKYSVKYPIKSSVKKLIKNPIIIKSSIILLFLIAYPITTYAVNETILKKLWYQLAILGKWAILLKGAYTIIVNFMNGDTKNIGKTVFLIAITYAAVLYLPAVLTWIETITK